MWQHFLLILLALANGKLSGIAAQVDKNVVCRGIRIGDVVPNPLDCASYFVCGTQKPILHFCDGGLHFDAEHKVCNWPEMANCKFGVVSIGGVPATVYPVFNETEFSSSSVKESVTESTMSTTPYNSTLDNISFGAFSTVDDSVIDPMVDYDPNRIHCAHRGVYFLPHPRSCQKYYFCAFGHLLQHQCGSGSTWNYRKMECEVANEADCYASSNGSTSHTETTANTETTTPTPTTPNSSVTVCYPVYTIINGITVTTWQPLWKPSSTTWSPSRVEWPQWSTETQATVTTVPTPPTAAKTTSGRLDIDSEPYCNDGVKYLGDFKDCTHYFICIQDSPVGMFCPKDSYWDYKQEICTSWERVQCLSAANLID